MRYSVKTHKNRKPISSSIDKELYKELDLLAQETQIPKSKLINKAIQLLIKEYKK